MMTAHFVRYRSPKGDSARVMAQASCLEDNAKVAHALEIHRAEIGSQNMSLERKGRPWPVQIIAWRESRPEEQPNEKHKYISRRKILQFPHGTFHSMDSVVTWQFDKGGQITTACENILNNMLSAGLPRVREKSGKNKIFSRSGNCQGILKKCQGILAIWLMSGKCQGILSWQLNF